MLRLFLLISKVLIIFMGFFLLFFLMQTEQTEMVAIGLLIFVHSCQMIVTSINLS